MPGYQKGDVPFMIGGKPYFLRLTLGALAEIDARLGVKGPIELAAKLKSFAGDAQSETNALILLECLLHPCLSSRAADIPSVASNSKASEFMPAVATLFESSFDV